MSRVNFIKRVYRNPIWRCPHKCGASSYKPKHHSDCPAVRIELEKQEKREKRAKKHNPKKLISRSWSQVFTNVRPVKDDTMRSIPLQVEEVSRLRNNEKLKQKYDFKQKEAWRDDLKPAWGMEFASTQGLTPEEILSQRCEPNEIVVRSHDGRLLIIDHDLLTIWPKDEAGHIIPPPCVNWWEPRDPNTGFPSGIFRIQNACINYDCCPFDHKPLEPVVEEHEKPDNPEILYGVSYSSRRPLDEYITGSFLLTVGEAEFRDVFYEKEGEEESLHDRFVTELTGIPVDEIPEGEELIGSAEWKIDCETARNELGSISHAYREYLRNENSIVIEDRSALFERELNQAAENPDLYDGIFDPVEECILDKIWMERHDELNSGKLKLIARGRNYDPENVGTGFSFTGHRSYCQYYSSAGFKNHRARKRMYISRRVIDALQFYVEHGNPSRFDMLTIRNHIIRSTYESVVEEPCLITLNDPHRVIQGSVTVKYGIKHDNHPFNRKYRDLITAMKKQWNTARRY